LIFTPINEARLHEPALEIILHDHRNSAIGGREVRDNDTYAIDPIYRRVIESITTELQRLFLAEGKDVKLDAETIVGLKRDLSLAVV